MIAAIIRGSVRNRMFVVLGAIALLIAGIIALRSTPVDALPDLSDVQVIIRTSFPGQAPQIVENQVTYPLTTTMLSVPGAKTVRGYSFFGDSFVYVLFEDGTDPYWARSRVLEYLNQVQRQLPDGAKSALGPDATGVGWIYEYALVDRTGRHDLAQLRVAAGLVPALRAEDHARCRRGRQHRRHGEAVPGRARSGEARAPSASPHAQVVDAFKSANQETGGSVLELGEAEYMVRASGYLKSLDDFRADPAEGGRRRRARHARRRRHASRSARRCGAASPN